MACSSCSDAFGTAGLVDSLEKLTVRPARKKDNSDFP